MGSSVLTDKLNSKYYELRNESKIAATKAKETRKREGTQTKETTTKTSANDDLKFVEGIVEEYINQLKVDYGQRIASLENELHLQIRAAQESALAWRMKTAALLQSKNNGQDPESKHEEARSIKVEGSLSATNNDNVFAFEEEDTSAPSKNTLKYPSEALFEYDMLDSQEDPQDNDQDYQQIPNSLPIVGSVPVMVPGAFESRIMNEFGDDFDQEGKENITRTMAASLSYRKTNFEPPHVIAAKTFQESSSFVGKPPAINRKPSII